MLGQSPHMCLVVGKPVSTRFRHFSAASRGISRVSVEPFVAMPCSQIPVGPQRLALSVSRCCPFLSIEEWTPTMWVISGFNRTALRLAVYASACAYLSACVPAQAGTQTGRANVAVDYATLASSGWLTLSASPSQATGFVQPISLFVSQTPPSVTDLSRRE